MRRLLPVALLVLTLPVQPAASQRSGARSCSLDAMPEAEKQQMIAEYQRRIRAEGKARADAWANARGDAFRERLVAAGVCPPLARDARRAPPPVRSGKKPLLNRQGRPCKQVGVENQVFPGFGGAPPTMGLVPVCQE